MSNNYEIDMTAGSLVKNILRFSIPLMFTNMLQLLYSAADVIVVGKFVGTHALAAVGSTGTLINLLINIFIDLSIGVAVLASRYFGAKDYKRLGNVVQTTFFISVVLGIISMTIGEIFAKKLLVVMGTPADVFSDATKYVTYYLMGVPGSMVFNFCAAILRSVGDTKRPFYILGFTGLVNVILNIVFITLFDLGVGSVAIATTVANYLSAILVVYSLCKSETVYKLHINKFHIDKQELKNIFTIGLPAGINGSIFSLANVVIQSAINSFGSNVVAAFTASINIENFVYSSIGSVHHGALTAISQNYGAKNKERIKKSLKVSLAVVVATGILVGYTAILFRKPLLGLYTNDPKVLSYAQMRLVFMCGLYFLFGIMEVLVGYLRGIGFSATPTVVSLIFSCAFRMIWVKAVLPQFNTIYVLMASWPLSWVLVAVVNIFIILTFGKKRLNKHIC